MSNTGYTSHGTSDNIWYVSGSTSITINSVKRKRTIHATELIEHGLGHIDIVDMISITSVLCPNDYTTIKFGNGKGETIIL